MNNVKNIFSLAVGAAILVTKASGADLPTTQPALISIVREQVKVGHNAAHARNEQGWPAAFEKAKHPYYSMALTSITGPNEALYIIPYESHAQMGDDFKRAEDDPVLGAELDRLSAEDEQHVSATSTIHAAARKDLSYGDFPDLAQMRLYHITVFTVRPGHDREFEEAGKAYIAARARAGVKAGFRTYQVLAGMPNPSYLVIESAKDFAELDKALDEETKTLAAATDQEKAALSKGMREAVLKEETNRYRIDPKQSYVPQETRKKAPDFWLK